MTTNIDRAAEVLYYEHVGSGDTADYLARRLADDGLLKPDSPEPDFIKKHPVPWKLASTLIGWAEVDQITDARGGLVAQTADASGYQSWLKGDMDKFIAFVNEYFANHAEEGDHDT